MKSNKGITLIALIITIIIMLILVGVVTNIIIKTQLLEVAKDATTRWNSAQMNESKSIDEVDKLIDEIVYNKVEPTEMYAALYSDGTLVFYKSSENILNERNGATLVKQTENISDTQELSEDELKALLFWVGDQDQADQITSVVIAEEIAPKSAKRLFMNLKNVESITDLNKLNTCNVTTMLGMFCNCSKLKNIDLSRFNTEKVTAMDSMFYGCSSLTNIDPSLFDTKNVTSMYTMFAHCTSLEKLNVSNFNTENVTKMQGMFYNCSNLQNADVAHFNTKNVISMDSMFCGCSKLEKIDVSNFNTSNTTIMSLMFYNCSNLKQLNVNNFNTEKVTTMRSMFLNCSKLEEIDISNWNTSNVEDMSWMFAGDDYGNPKNTMILKQIIGIEDLDVSNVKSMDRMFRHCHELTSLDLHKWNVSNVEIMRQLFNSCTSLSELNIGNWDMGNVTNTQYMFNNCPKLNSTITLSVDNTKLTTYGGTFNGTATDSGCLVTVNYTSSAAEIIDNIIATKTGNVQKGTQVSN